MYNTDDVKPAPDSWSAVFDPSSPYKGKITAYDSPIYIADAALYLMATQPDLGITNPYELDEEQFNAAVDLLKQQNDSSASTGPTTPRRVQAFTNGDSDGRHDLAGDRPTARRPTRPAGRRGAAEGGLDRLVGHVDDQLGGQASELHVHVDELHHRARRPRPQVAEWFGEAPANPKACAVTRPIRITARLRRRRRAVPRRASTTGRLRSPTAATTAATSARTTTTGSRPGRRSRADRPSDAGDRGSTRLVAPAPEVGGPQARRPLPRPSAPAGSGRCWPARSAGWSSRYLGSLAVLLVASLLVARRAQRRGRAHVHARQLQRRSLTEPVYRTVTLRTIGDRGRGHGHRRAARLAARVLHGEGREAAARRGCSSSRC